MVEVHLEGFVALATVHAGDSPQIPEHFDSAGLPDPHSRDLEFAITPVVVDVRSPLARSRGHGLF